ncbi:MAG: DUF3000 domain-containing protein [Pseudonocardiaceae bacterium]
MPDLADAPEVFRTGVACLSAVRPRPEVRFEPIPAPGRLAPWTYAWGLEVLGNPHGDDHTGDHASATGRLVLLHEPRGQDAWHGTMRLVGFVRADLDVEFVGDPLLPAVGWSWLTDALHCRGADCTALGGTVTQTSSVRFGEIVGPERFDEVELRASWTPVGENLGAHAEAFCELIAAVAGLPPVGIVALAKHRD